MQLFERNFFMTRSNLLALTSAVAFTIACDSNPIAPSDVIGDTWRLVSLVQTGSTPVTIDDPTKYTLTFQDDERVGVKSDCNTCGGPFALSDSSLEMGPLACTKVACGEGSQDVAFTRALDSSRSVSLDDDELTILGEGVRLTFVRD
jgi:heat shock protein HslJ